MSKLIYAKSKAGFEVAFPDRTSANPIYNSVVFTEDGYLFTHGQYFRIFPNAASIFTSTTTNGIATIVDAKTPATTLGTINVGVTSVLGGNILSNSVLTNGVITIDHDVSGVTLGSYGPTTDKSDSIVIPKLTVDTYGHITSAGTQTATLNRVKATLATGAFYFLGHTSSSDVTNSAEAVKISSIYGDDSGNLTATKFIGSLNKKLSVILNGTTVDFNNSADVTHTFYAPATAGTSGDILKSNGSGAPTWLSLSTSVSSGSTDSQVPSALAVYAAINSGISANDAMIFKGVIDASTNPNYPSADRGSTYKISVAGKIGGVSGVAVEAGDTIICITDSTDAGDQATVGANWSVLQTNIVGAVTSGAALATGTVILGAGGQATKSLATGTVGLFLQSGGGTADPIWAAQTLNTAGTTNLAGTKLFLAGATTQAANPQTYSNVNVYIGTDNKLYSNGSVVLTTADVINNLASNGSTTTPLSAAQGYILDQKDISGISYSGTTLTLTKKDSSTFTVTPPTWNQSTTGAATQITVATCATDAATAAKVVVLPGFTLVAGVKAIIKFTAAGTASATLNINSTTAKALYYNGVVVTAAAWTAGDLVEVQYDGTQYHIIFVNSDSETNKPMLAGDITGNAVTVTTTAADGNAYLFGSTSAAGAGSITMRSANIYMNGGTLTASTFSGALSGNATSASNLAGGVKGNIAYQNSAGATVFLAPGTSGQFLKFDSTGVPVWAADNNSWRNVSAYTIASPTTPSEVLSTSIGLSDLQFGSEFIWDSTNEELKLGWAEIDGVGVITYSI